MYSIENGTFKELEVIDQHTNGEIDIIDPESLVTYSLFNCDLYTDISPLKHCIQVIGWDKEKVIKAYNNICNDKISESKEIYDRFLSIRYNPESQ